VIAILAGCAVVLHKSFRFVDKGPLLGVDDALPNVAITLAERGRYGDLGSPTQGPYDVDRTHAFFNYGPLYFYVAAALTWLIGPSFIAFRMLHPLGLVAIVGASFLVWRRYSVIGSAVLAAGILHIYLHAHWPMARPDIMVSICAVSMFVAASRAVERGGWLAWFATGFFAGAAVSCHQIAASVALAAGVIWVWSVLVERRKQIPRSWRPEAASLLALISGGALAALIYLHAIDFRLRDCQRSLPWWTIAPL